MYIIEATFESRFLISVFVKVIRHRRNWSIQLRALIERSELERQNKRRVERACSQMDSIAKLLDGFDHVKVHESMPTWNPSSTF